MGLFDDVLGPAPNAGRSGLFDDVLKKPDVGRGTALMTGINQGFSANFGDELAGLGAASVAGTPIPDAAAHITLPAFGIPVEKLAGLARMGYEALTGKGEATKAYEAARDQMREQYKTAKEQYPGTTLVGELTGAVATPIPGAALRGATTLGRAARSAGVGAGVGALSGAGAGEDLQSRITGAATGGAVGGVVGGAASPVVDLAARGVSNVAGQAGRYLFPNVDARAQQAIQGAVKSAEKTDPTAAGRLTAVEVAANPAATAADLGGEPGRALARWASNASPEARDTLSRMTNDRYEGQAERVVGWLNKTFNYPDAAAQEAAIKAAKAPVNSAYYKRAYAEGDRDIYNPELERLTAAPYVQSALGSAISKWKNYQVRDGYGAANPPFRIENGGLVRTGGKGMPAYPNIQLWDYAARELQDAARNAKPGSQEAGLFNDLARMLKNELDKEVPSYRAARETAKAYFGQENALKLGESWIGKTDPRQVAREWGSLNPQERQLAQDGFVSAFMKSLGDVRYRGNILDKINQSPNATSTLNMVLGRSKAAELESMLRVENIMQQTRVAQQGNSTTARQLIELGVVGTGGGAASWYSQDPMTMAQTAIAGALVVRGRGTDRRVAQRVAEMLTSRDPAVLTRGLQTVARNQNMMQGLRALDQRLARISGSQGTGAAGPQAAGIGRAEENQ